MSGINSPSPEEGAWEVKAPGKPPRSGLGCCAKISLTLLVLLLASGAFGLWAVSAMRSEAPLPFKAFRYRALERSLLTAKFEFLELPSRLLTGGTTEIRLDERELNALLFGNAAHRDDGEKARVLIQGDLLRIEYSRPEDDGSGWLNVQGVVRCSLGPQAVSLELVEGQVGSYTLGPFSRPAVESALRQGLQAQYDKDPRLGRIKSLSVADGRATVIYQPQ